MVRTGTPRLRRFPVGGQGPEDVAVRGDRIITGVADGRLLSVSPDGAQVDLVADTGGRPLGIEVMPDGRLVVCDAQRGLLRVDPEVGSVDALTGTIASEPMKLCNNAAVTADGTIYFTDSSRRYGLDGYQADVVERTGTGRLLRRDATGGVQVLLDHLEFANGVALANDESFVAVAETGAGRVLRVWLSGPRAGESDVLIDDLPGMPDNLSTGADGRIWIAIPVPRVRALRLVGRAPRAVRKFVGRVASGVSNPPMAAARVLAIDRDGTPVVRMTCSRRCGYRMVTGVREYDGSLYLGSLSEEAIACISPVPSAPTEQLITIDPDR